MQPQPSDAKRSLPKRMGAAVLRTALLFVTFHVIFFLTEACFMSIIREDEEMLSPRAVGAWLFALQMLLFESTVFAFHRHRTEARSRFTDAYPRCTLTDMLKDLFLSAEFYIEYVGIALLSCLLPLRYAPAGAAFFGESFTKGQLLLVVLPALLALDIVAHLSVRAVWAADKPTVKADKKELSPLARTIRGVVFVAGIYCGAGLILSWYMPFLVTMNNLGGVSLGLYIAAAAVIAILAVVGAYFIRALKKRKDFIVRLQKYCKAQGMTLSDIRKPYRSVFKQQKGTDFTLRIGGQTNGQTFACKFVSGVFPASPIIFADTGEGIRQDTLRLFRVDLLHFNTRLDFRMEDSRPDDRKIIIVLPVPQRIYASVNAAPPRPADTGEVIGEYTLYTASGFLGALERGHLY